MAAKGTIKPDHIAVNKYQLLVLGMPPITAINVSGIEEELETTDLPDRTRASGGNTKAVSFTFKVPAHHKVEQAALELWFQESQDPVLPTYKKVATFYAESGTGNVVMAFTLTEMFLTKRSLPEFAMDNEGEMAAVEWSASADDVIPVPV